MRIAHVTFSFWPIRGGADVYLAELYRALAVAGHAQTVYQAALPTSQNIGTRRTHLLSGSGGDLPVVVVEWPVEREASPGRRFWLLSLEVARRRGELARFDRIICHYPNYLLPLLGHPGLIGLSHGVTWDCEAMPGPPGDGEPFRPLPLRSASNRMKRGIAAAAFRFAWSYVANDTFFLREMGLPIMSGDCPWQEAAPRRWFLPNAVDTARFAPAPEDLTQPVILLARNFYRNRGIHIGIGAFARLTGDWPDYRLRIAGDDGDAGYREECEALSRSLDLRHRVEFAGAVPWAEMAGEYRRAAVSWIPSLCGEGTSLSALESMACGTPVLASYAGGLPDLPCAHSDLHPNTWAAATSELLQRREEISRSQREAVLKGFTLQRWGDAWRAVVER